MSLYCIPLTRPAENRLMLGTRCESIDDLNRYFAPDPNSPESLDPPQAQRITSGKYKGRLAMPAKWLGMMGDGVHNVNVMWVFCAREPAIQIRGFNGEYGDEMTSAELIEERERERRQERGESAFLRRHGLL